MADLKNIIPGRHVVVGFFTPNYCALATTFAANLQEHGQPYHLYARPAMDWHDAILQKPGVVLGAMDQYPERAIVLMDVDCAVRGDLAPLAECAADAALHFRVKQNHVYPFAYTSTRLIVFRPTPKARELAAAWQACCAEPRARNDEARLMLALSRVMGVSVMTIACPSAPGEKAHAHHPFVTHASAHAATAPLHVQTKARLQRWKRRIFKHLTGRDYVEWKYGARAR